MLTLEELTTPLTTDQVSESIYARLVDLGITTTTWKPGAVARTLIAVFSAVFASFTVWSAKAVKAGFLLLASDDWLTAKTAFDLGTTRTAATYATGYVDLTLSAAGSYSWDPGDLVLQASLAIAGQTQLKYYANTETVTITSAGSTVTVSDVVVQAQEIGASSTAPPNTIVTVVPALANLSVTNPAAVVGQDEESDVSLRARAALQASAISPAGAADAYRYIATTTLSPVSGGQIADRVKVVPGTTVSVYVAGASGEVSGSIGDPLTDLGAINLALQTQVVPIGVTALLYSATTINLDFTYTVSCYTTSLTDAEIDTLVQAAVAAALPDVPIGGNPPFSGSTGYYYRDALLATIVDAIPSCFHATTSLSADVPLDAGQALVLGTVTQTVVNRYTA